MTEIESKILSFGDDLENLFAARLVVMAGEDPKAAQLLETASKVNLLERQVMIVMLGDRLQSIGNRWRDLTFNRTPSQKDRELPELKEDWASIDLLSLDPEERSKLIERFIGKGLKVREEDRPSQAIKRYARPAIKGLGFTRNLRPVERFLDGVDPEIRFSAASYVTLGAILELADYPNNPTLDNLQVYLAQDQAKAGMIGRKGYVELRNFQTQLNNWITSCAASIKA